LKITFLGTGTSQGVPVIGCKCSVCLSGNAKDKRLRTSVMIENKGNVFVIDTGPDFRQQMLRENVENLTAVVFTHEHKDHVAGLDDVRAFNYILKKNIDVYATERVQAALRREFHYIFSGDDYPGIPRINVHTIGYDPFLINNTAFIPIKLFHYKLPVLGFRVGDFTYITDTNLIPEEEKEKIYGSKILVLNALRKEKHISHFNLEEAIELMKELKPEKGYLIHISHQLGLHSEIEKSLPDFIRLSYDGLCVEI
jgi:phosphoribosyl 1,2-cyclic phosphate phosphodiesterase